EILKAFSYVKKGRRGVDESLAVAAMLLAGRDEHFYRLASARLIKSSAGNTFSGSLMLFHCYMRMGQSRSERVIKDTLKLLETRAGANDRMNNLGLSYAYNLAADELLKARKEKTPNAFERKLFIRAIRLAKDVAFGSDDPEVTASAL